jgi:hypothetical protein
MRPGYPTLASRIPYIVIVGRVVRGVRRGPVCWVWGGVGVFPHSVGRATVASSR